MAARFPGRHRRNGSAIPPGGATETQLQHGVLWESEADLDVTMVVPFFNPGDRLRPTVEELIAALLETGVTFEIIAVCDGSTDASLASLGGLPTETVRTVVFDDNRGKGEAIRQGFCQARGGYLGFIDADGDLPPRQIARYVEASGLTGTSVGEGSTGEGSPGPDYILGSKLHPDSNVTYPPVRWLYSKIWQSVVWALFRLPVRDTQTGIKLLRRDVVAAVLPWTVEKRFTFDLELLAIGWRLGFRSYREMPAIINERVTSTVTARGALTMFGQIFRIFYRLHVDGPPRPGPVPSRVNPDPSSPSA